MSVNRGGIGRVWAALATGCVLAATAGCPYRTQHAASNGAATKAAWSDVELARVRSGEQTMLTAPNATVTDADLALLAGLDKLERLVLDNVKITDSGVAHLAGLKKLKALHVTDISEGHASVGDAGIAALSKLDDLEELLLPSPNATDAAADALAKVAKLRVLNLGATQFSDAGVKKLAALPKLELLRIGGPKVTDAALAHIAKIATLKQLLLVDAPITDAELSQLLALDKLESFYVDRTKITKEGLSKIAEAKPAWHIHHDDAHVGGDHDHDE
ncbi:MAG: hypothetical protein DCC68_20030 [Planctomycetota bacterium]|nr:MAG: hypothetical protein DCC68_20030 [Planctomycetota bacterium]